jgi:beta-glucosidase
MNSYSPVYLQNRGDQPPDINEVGLSRGIENDTGWLRTTEKGWAKLLRWSWNRYATPIHITKNGITARGEHDWAPKGSDDILEDPHRADLFTIFLTKVAQAFQEGIISKPYCGWTFADNWNGQLGSRTGLWSPESTFNPKEDAICQVIGILHQGLPFPSH